jgi:hypothetical protein
LSIVVYSASFTNSTFTTNRAVYGGAIFGSIRGSMDQLVVQSSIFDRNNATTAGGAIHWRTWPSTVIIENSQFHANKAVNSSAIYLLAIGTISNSNFTENLSTEYGIVSLEQRGSASFLSSRYAASQRCVLLASNHDEWHCTYTHPCALLQLRGQ